MPTCTSRVGNQDLVNTSGGQSWTARVTEVLDRSQRGSVACTTQKIAKLSVCSVAFVVAGSRGRGGCF